MTKPLEAIETAVAGLAPDDFAKFRRWFLEIDKFRRTNTERVESDRDDRMAKDAASGILDFLREEARQAKQSGELRPL